MLHATCKSRKNFKNRVRGVKKFEFKLRLLPLRFRKAGKVLCGGARETH